MFQLKDLKKLSFVIVTLLFLGFAASAKADTVLVVGNSTGSLSTATLTCVISGNTVTLTLVNTSPFDARITGFGFDLGAVGNTNSASGVNGFSGSVTSQPGGVDFEFTDGSMGNVPQFNSAVLDFGFITRRNTNSPTDFAGGFPNEGLAPGGQAVFSVTGAFNGMSEADICNAIFVRFQRVGSNGEGSDVGVPTAIPEPASLILLGAGLTGFATVIRKKKRT